MKCLFGEGTISYFRRITAWFLTIMLILSYIPFSGLAETDSFSASGETVSDDETQSVTLDDPDEGTYHLVTFATTNPNVTFSISASALATPADYYATASDATEGDADMATDSSAASGTAATLSNAGEDGALPDGEVTLDGAVIAASSSDALLTGLSSVTVFVKHNECLTEDQIPTAVSSSRWIGIKGWKDEGGYYFAGTGLLVTGITQDTVFTANTFSTRMLRAYASGDVCYNLRTGTAYQTFAEAVSAAVTGDSIELLRASYNVSQQIDFSGKSLTVEKASDYLGAAGTTPTFIRTAGGYNMFYLHNGAGLTLNNVCVNGNNVSNAGIPSTANVKLIESSVFVMDGTSSIINSLGMQGASVNINASTFTMQGHSSISGSTSTDAGQIDLYNGSTVNIRGNASITGNTGTSTASTVFLRSSGNKSTLNIGENAVISGNTSTSGGVESSLICSHTNAGTINISGNASITGNTFNNACIRLQSGNTLNMTGGSITGNTVNAGGNAKSGGIYAISGSTVALSGTPVIKNNANNQTAAQKDLVLDTNTSLTVKGNLLSGARVGVYCLATNGMTSGNQFGVTSVLSNKVIGLQYLFSDNNTSQTAPSTTATDLFGYAGGPAVSTVVWGGKPVAKIVDSTGNVKLYSTLAAAVADANAQTSATTIQMLVDYTENASWTVTNTSANVTITTAKTLAGGCTDGYPYTGSAADGKAVITVGSAYQYKMNAAGRTLTFDGINLTGTSRSTAGIEIDAGEIDVKDTTVKSFVNIIDSSPGGAFYVKAGKLVLGSSGVSDTTSVTGCVAASSQNNAAVTGGSIAYVADGASAEVRGGTYSGNGGTTGTQYRLTGFAVGSGGTGAGLTISGGTFSNNNGSHGGLVNVYGANSTVTVSGGTFTGNYAYFDGGVIYRETAGTLNLTGGTFTGNSCGRAGSVCSLRGGVLNISGNPDIENNKCAVRDTGASGVFNSLIGSGDATVNLSGAPVIKGNTYNGTTIKSDLSVNSATQLQVGTLTGNSSSIGICSKNASTTYTASGVQFGALTSNASATVGDFHFFNDSDANLKAYKFAGSTPLKWGYGICKIGTVIYPTLESAVAACSSGTATTTGTADTYKIEMLVNSYEIASQISMPAGKNITIEPSEDPADNVTTCTFTPSTGITAGTALFDIPSTAALTLNKVVLDGSVAKSATKNLRGVSNESGGSLTVTDSTIENFYVANMKGAGIYSAGTTLINGSSVLTGNFAVGSSSWNGGGAVFVNGGTTTIGGNTSVTRNKGLDGGAIAVSGNGTLNLQENASITNNYAMNPGGAVYLYASGAGGSGTFNMTGGTISNNYAGTYGGGGVMIHDGSTMNLSSGTITGNTTAGSNPGGGIYLVSSSGKLNVSGNPVVSGNTTGGSISETFAVTAGSVKSNVQLTDGNYVTVTGDMTTGASVGITAAGNDAAGVSRMVSGGQFGNTSASSASNVKGLSGFFRDTNTGSPDDLYGMAGAGNAVVWGTGTCQIIHTDANGNKTCTGIFTSLDLACNSPLLQNGDTIEVFKSHTVTATGTLSGKTGITIKTAPTGTPSATGAMVFQPASGETTTAKVTRGSTMTAGSLISVTGSTVTTSNIIFDGGNVSASGSVINVSGTSGVVNVNSGTVFQNNKATGNNGGAVTVLSGNTVNISGATFNSNSAGMGGAIYSAGANVTVADSSFTGNTVSVAGGAILNMNGTLAVSSSGFFGNSSNNTAYGFGGAVYSTGTFTLNGGTFTGNTGSKGSAIFTDKVTMSGINTITGNTDNGTKRLGAVYISSATPGAMTVSGKLTVSGNSDTSGNAGNVSLVSGGIIQLNGTLDSGSSIGVTVIETDHKVNKNFARSYNTDGSAASTETARTNASYFTDDRTPALAIGANAESVDGVKTMGEDTYIYFRGFYLKLSKRVSGAYADETKKFTFTIVLKDSTGTVMTGTYPYYGVSLSTDFAKPADGTFDFSSGSATISLSHAQQIDIEGLPVGCRYTITENAETGYTGSRTDDGTAAAGTMNTGDVTVKYLNSKVTIVPSGIKTDGEAEMRFLMILLPLLAGALLVFRHRKCKTGKN